MRDDNSACGLSDQFRSFKNPTGLCGWQKGTRTGGIDIPWAFSLSVDFGMIVR
jgi:hypothetical protein